MRRPLSTWLFVVNLVVIVIAMSGAVAPWQKSALPFGYASSDARYDSLDAYLRVARPYRDLFAGDKIVAIDGHEVFSAADVEFLTDSKLPGEHISLRVIRGGRTIDADVTLVRFYSALNFIVLLFTGLLYISFGLIVLTKRPDERAARVLNSLALSTAIVVFNTWGYYTQSPLALGVLQRFVFGLGFVMTPACLLEFSLVFPRELTRYTNRIVISVYAAALCIALTLGYRFYEAASTGSITRFHSFNSLFTFSSAFFGILLLASILCFVLNYRAAEAGAERKKLQWVMLGIAFSAVSYFGLWQFPKSIGFDPLVSDSTLLLLSTVAPITFLIAILKYHVLNIDTLLNRATVYAIVVAIALTLYAVLVGTVAVVLGNTLSADSSTVLSAVAAIITALMFEPLKRRVQRLVDLSFFRISYDYREAQRQIGKQLADALTTQELSHTLLAAIDGLFFPAFSRVMLRKPDGSVESYGSPLDQQQSESSREPAGRRECVEPEVLPIGELPDGIALSIPLLTHAENVQGVLQLGSKRSGKRYLREDIDLIISLSEQASLGIERSTLMEQVLEEKAESERQRELSELKSLFVSSVTHDLKTPLTSIKLFSQLLLQSEPKADAKEYLTIIEGESDRLTTLIDNVLDHAKIERGVMDYTFSTVDLNDSIRQVVSALRYLIEMQGFTLTIDLTPHPLFVEADPAILYTIFANLISNALKYSDARRQLAVHTAIERDPSNQVFAAAIVSDSGAGIPDKDLPFIFEPYYRASANKHLALQAGGSGLGLANVRHAMKAHAGTVDVTSEMGQGTSFTLRFPLRPLEEHA